MGRYANLMNRRMECVKLYEATKDDNYLMEMDCLDHFVEAESNAKYEVIAKFCKERGFSKTYDIGCAYGHQSEIFLLEDVNYVGIDQYCTNFWNKDKFKFITKAYPFKINANSNDLAVSVLCLTWNCYLMDGEVTLHNQLKQLSYDFNNCLLYIAKDKVDVVKEYFKGYEYIGDNFHYFYK